MTHKQKLIQLLKDLGIRYHERTTTSQTYTSESGFADTSPWETAIDLEEGVGLPGFVTSFYFDGDEAFLAHRVWKR